MRHLYFDTSDLNTPYDQYGGARPLQGVGTAQHVYQDYSLLNAQYAEARPAVQGLGSGSLGGSALGNVDAKVIGIGTVPDTCPLWTGAHHRMYTGAAAMADDVDLMAVWNRNTDQWGCPVRAASHWFWPNAPTSEWSFRGPTDKFVKDDWDALSPDWTLYIPPFVTDMGNTYSPFADQAVAVPQTPTTPASASADRVDPSEITPQVISKLQTAINTQLSSMGCRSISVDGKLGKETCGALLYIDHNAEDLTAEMQEASGPYLATVFEQMCSNFEYGCTASSAPVTTPSSPHLTTLTRTPTLASSVPNTNWLVGGALAVAAVLIGGAVIYKRGT